MTTTASAAPAETMFAAFRAGFLAPWAGFRYLRQHPGLWRYGLIPIVLNVLITALVLLLLLAAIVIFVVYLHPHFPAGWFGALVEVLCAVVFLLLALAVTLAAWVLLQAILCGYFNEQLAREVEIHLGVRPGDLRDIPWLHQLGGALRNVAFLAAVNLAVLFVHIIPLVGSVIGVSGSLYFDCSTFGREYLGYPLYLRGPSREEEIAFFRKHRIHALGLGAAVLLANLVPFVGPVVSVAAVVGAVLLHRRLAAPPVPVCRQGVTSNLS